MKKMLEGILVVDCTLAAAGPACSKILTDLGAEDILIEPLEGTSSRSDAPRTFHFKSGGKKSVAVNLKTPEGREFMYRLIERADVFVSNYRKAALERLGLGYDTLSKLNPRLVYAAISGYGNHGPKKADPGFDVTCFWARGGIMADISQRDEAIINAPIAIGDVSTGQVLAIGICAALYNRAMTGKGSYVNTSLLGQAVWLNYDAIIEAQHGEEYPKSRKAPMRAAINTYQCGDGKWFTLNSQHHWETSWPCICNFIGRPDLIEKYPNKESTMYENSAEVVAALDEGFRKFTREEVLQALTSCGTISAEPVQHSKDLLTDPQVLDNEMLIETDKETKEGKKVMIPAMPLRFDDDHPAEYRPDPKLGEHSVEVMNMLGYDESTIKDYIERGIFVSS